MLSPRPTLVTPHIESLWAARADPPPCFVATARSLKARSWQGNCGALVLVFAQAMKAAISSQIAVLLGDLDRLSGAVRA